MIKKIDTKRLETELINLDTQLKRALADYRNLERRVTDDALSAAHHSRSELVVKLLPVLDSLDTALAGASEMEAESGWFQGVVMAVKQLRQVLAEEGLSEIDTSGQFDPNLHEAIDLKEGENDKILELAQRGYTLNGRVIRPARVVVGRSLETS